jgi:uncharacterized protein (TIGR04255 family)
LEMKFPHLSKAPIIEAVIDIQTVCKDDATPDQRNARFLGIHEKLKPEFPEIQIRSSKQIQLSGSPGETAVQDFIDGYFFKSADGADIAQFRQNGFALSRVQRYETFDALLATTQRLWKVYLSVCGKIEITRLAVRYINQVRVPFPLEDNDDYLAELRKPKTSPAETKAIKGFADQIVSLDVTSGATVGLVRVMQEPPANATDTSVIIDIDTSRAVSGLSNEDQQIWDIIASFRDVKNRVFFESVGKRVVEAYI